MKFKLMVGNFNYWIAMNLLKNGILRTLNENINKFNEYLYFYYIQNNLDNISKNYHKYFLRYYLINFPKQLNINLRKL